jgi:hypothetical protein
MGLQHVLHEERVARAAHADGVADEKHVGGVGRELSGSRAGGFRSRRRRYCSHTADFGRLDRFGSLIWTAGLPRFEIGFAVWAPKATRPMPGRVLAQGASLARFLSVMRKLAGAAERGGQSRSVGPGTVCKATHHFMRLLQPLWLSADGYKPPERKDTHAAQ